MKKSNKIYYVYILLSVLCPLIIWVYYLGGIACIEATMTELVSAVFAVVLAFFAIREFNAAGKPIAAWLSISGLQPVIFLIFQPNSIRDKIDPAVA